MLLAPLHDPVRVAEDAATVSLLSSGRLTLGLANGYCDREFEGFGVDKRDRALRTSETIDIARRAWSAGPLGFDPRTHPITADVDVTPTPDDPPRIVLGGTAKPAVRRAALLADGWMAPGLLSLDEIAKRVRYQRRLREVERVDGEFTVYVLLYCFVDESRAAAWDRIREPLYYTYRVYDEMATGTPVDELSRERRERIRERAVFGAPADVTSRLATYREALGDDAHVILRTYYPGLDTDAMRACNERLRDEVIPELR